MNTLEICKNEGFDCGRCMKRHQEKLGTIIKKRGNASTIEQNVSTVVYQNKLKNNHFKVSGKFREGLFWGLELNNELSKGNQRLLSRLVEISHGKHMSVPPVTEPKAIKKSKSRSLLEPIGPKSMNIILRKTENDRILRENQQFAKRLFEK